MQFEYIGSELELFSHAKNWKNYWSSKINRHLGKSVLEVGAGIGSATKLLSSNENIWTALEPDKSMVEKLLSEQLPKNTTVICGTLEDLDENTLYDSIVYLDVLEHISDDASELMKASKLLRNQGKLVVLAPAHNWLMSAFDLRIGHFRRYSKRTLEAIRPPGMVRVTSFYLDSLGLLASIANRILLRQGEPTRSQISFWDSVLVPLSRVLDKFLFGQVGKTVIVVWEKS
jgi:SAM-dependent methyltransferase